MVHAGLIAYAQLFTLPNFIGKLTIAEMVVIKRVDLRLIMIIIFDRPRWVLQLCVCSFFFSFRVGPSKAGKFFCLTVFFIIFESITVAFFKCYLSIEIVDNFFLLIISFVDM